MIFFSLLKALLACIKNIIHSMSKGYIDIFFCPFNPNRPLPRNAIYTLVEILKDLSRLKIDYMVTDGTILGLYRDKKLIPHDNDIDIALLNSKKIFQLIIYYIIRGWFPIRILIKGFHLYQIVFYKKKVLLDFCNWKQKDNIVYFKAPEIEGIRVQSLDYYFPKKYTLRGIELYSHPKLEKWIEEHYGSDWKTPKIVKGDWREDCQDIVNNYN